MNDKQENLLAIYRSWWVELNAVNSLIADLEDRRREIKSKQREIANRIAATTEDLND